MVTLTSCNCKHHEKFLGLDLAYTWPAAGEGHAITASKEPITIGSLHAGSYYNLDRGVSMQGDPASVHYTSLVT